MQYVSASSHVLVSVVEGVHLAPPPATQHKVAPHTPLSLVCGVWRLSFAFSSSSPQLQRAALCTAVCVLEGLRQPLWGFECVQSVHEPFRQPSAGHMNHQWRQPLQRDHSDAS